MSPADLLSHSKSKICWTRKCAWGARRTFCDCCESLSIPTIVGLKNLLKNIKNNEKVVLDGEKGLLIKNPTNQTVNFTKKIEEQKNKDKGLNYLKKIIPKT